MRNVRLINGKWQCAHCGAELDVSGAQTPRVVIVSAGGQPTMRTLVIDGHEVHRCLLHQKKR